MFNFQDQVVGSQHLHIGQEASSDPINSNNEEDDDIISSSDIEW